MDREALAGFLRACAADPASDGPRLVMADWLEEGSNTTHAAWAELIRYGCQNPTEILDASYFETDEFVSSGYSHEWRLWNSYCSPIIELLPKARWSRVLIRGLPDGLIIASPSAAELACSLASAIPIESMMLHCRPNPNFWSSRRLLDRLCKLEIDPGAELTGSMLWLQHDLERSMRLPRLDTLSIRRCSFNQSFVKKLCHPDSCPRLRRLIASGNLFTEQAIRQIVSAPLAGRLVELNLEGNPLGDEAIEELTLGLKRFVNLESLHVGRSVNSSVSGRAWARLAAAYGDRLIG